MPRRTAKPFVRRLSIVVGALLVAVGVGGLGLLAVAAMFLGPHRRVSAIAGTTTPAAVSFDTTDRRYDIALGARTTSTTGAVLESIMDASTDQADGAHHLASDGQRTRCTVRHPDGTTQVVVGKPPLASVDPEGAAEQPSLYVKVGAFRGQPGRTRMRCTFDEGAAASSGSGPKATSADAAEGHDVMVGPAGLPASVRRLALITFLCLGAGTALLILAGGLSSRRRRTITLPSPAA